MMYKMKINKKLHIRKKGVGKGKIRLSTSHHYKYCLCCGRKSQYIWNKLLEAKPNDRGVREWNGHMLYPSHKSLSDKQNNYFYDGNTTDFCESCGERLDDEEVNSCYESRGEFWGAPCSENIVTGYKCGNCGYEVTF